MSRISAIDLKAFRGVRDEVIELAGKSLFILGENGSGKSSIIDALEFFFTGTVSHLEGVQSLSTKRHAPHVHLAPESLGVAIRFQGFDELPTRTLKTAPTTSKALGPSFLAAASSRFILRRQQLLAFLLEQAAPRYQQLARLIGADELDAVETAWKSAVDAAETRYGGLLARVDEAQKSLEGLFGKLGSLSEDVILAALNARLVSLAQVPLSSLAEAESRKLAILGEAGHRERAEQSVQFARLRTASESVVRRLKALTGHASLWEGVTSLQTEAAKLRELRFRDVLRQAKVLVEEYDLDTCPVCEQPIEAVDVADQLTRRLFVSEALGERLVEVQKRIRSLREDLQTLGREARTLRTAIEQDESLVHQHAALTAADLWCDEFVGRLGRDVHEIDLGKHSAFVEAEVLAVLSQACGDLHSSLTRRIDALAETAADKRIIQAIDLLTRTADAYHSLRSSADEAVLARKTSESLRYIYETLVDVKKMRIQAIYDELEADIGRYYDLIHPAETHGDVRLEVVTTKRGSAEIKMGFAGKGDLDPRAYNSEAHLDSLGLCIFLAFVKHFNKGIPYLALDDVVSSVDASHRGRICKLLFTEFPSHQLFVTTHDAMWFEQLLAARTAFAFEPVRVLRIVTWTLDDGPRFEDHKPRWTAVREKVAANDKQGAASLCRKTLEWMLFEVAVGIEAPVSLRREGRYDVGALLDPVINRAKKLIPDFEATNKATLTDFASTSLLGNLLTHNNAFAETASIDDVKAFVESTEALFNIFFCSKCGVAPRYYRELKMIRCGCTDGGKHWQTK